MPKWLMFNEIFYAVMNTKNIRYLISLDLNLKKTQLLPICILETNRCPFSLPCFEKQTWRAYHLQLGNKINLWSL